MIASDEISVSLRFNLRIKEARFGRGNEEKNNESMFLCTEYIYENSESVFVGFEHVPIYTHVSCTISYITTTMHHQWTMIFV